MSSINNISAATRYKNELDDLKNRINSGGMTSTLRISVKQTIGEYYSAIASNGSEYGQFAYYTSSEKTNAGIVANDLLRVSIKNHHPNYTVAQVEDERDTIMLELAINDCELRANYSGIELDAEDVAKYHFDVFDQHQLDPGTWGGYLFHKYLNEYQQYPYFGADKLSGETALKYLGIICGSFGDFTTGNLYPLKVFFHSLAEGGVELLLGDIHPLTKEDFINQLRPEFRAYYAKILSTPVGSKFFDEIVKFYSSSNTGTYFYYNFNDGTGSHLIQKTGSGPVIYKDEPGYTHENAIHLISGSDGDVHYSTIILKNGEEYHDRVIQDTISLMHDPMGITHITVYDENHKVIKKGKAVCGDDLVNEVKSQFQQGSGPNADSPQFTPLACGEGGEEEGMFFADDTIVKDADGVLQDLTDVVTSFGEASAEFAAYVIREGSSAVAQGFKDFNLGSVLGRLFAKYGQNIVDHKIDKDAFFRDFVLECGYELLGKSFIPAGIKDYDKAFGGLLETAGFADGSVLANSLKGAIFSIAAKFALDSKGMDGDDYAKAGLSVVMGTAIDHVVSHNWGIGGPMGSGTTAALVSIATSLINNPKLDEAALRQITVTAGVAFASVAAAELIVGTLAEVSVGAGALSCATVGSVTSGAISSGLTSTFGASAGGAIFTGLSAAVVPVVGAIIGVLISQGIGLVYKGVKLYDGQYMSAEELRNATFRVEDIDGKKVMYATDKNGLALGPWWNKPVDVLVGGIGSDILKATDGRDTQLLGKEGSDYIEGKFGNDLLDGGLGNDFLLGADGDDVMFCGEGSDILDGTAGVDMIYADSGNDIVSGGTGADVIYGDDGEDVLLGGGEDDVMSGDADDDVLDGGAGNDRLNGGLGADMMTGSFGSDALSGDEGNDRLDGASGDDLLEGKSGKDVLIGDSGKDVLRGGSGNDVLDGGVGNDFLDGGLGDDALNGGEGNDELIGSLGNDVLYAGAGKDTLIGGEGADVLAGGYGADLMQGGKGDDVYVVSNDNGLDTIDEEEGKDTLIFAESLPSTLEFSRKGDDLIIKTMRDIVAGTLSTPGTEVVVKNHFSAENARPVESVELIHFKDTPDHALNPFPNVGTGNLFGDPVTKDSLGNDIAPYQLERHVFDKAKIYDLSSLSRATDGVITPGSGSVRTTVEYGDTELDRIGAAEREARQQRAEPMDGAGDAYRLLREESYAEATLQQADYAYYNGSELLHFTKKRSIFGGKYDVFQVLKKDVITGMPEYKVFYTLAEYNALSANDKKAFDSSVAVTERHTVFFGNYAPYEGTANYVHYIDIVKDGAPIFSYEYTGTIDPEPTSETQIIVHPAGEGRFHTSFNDRMYALKPRGTPEYSNENYARSVEGRFYTDTNPVNMLIGADISEALQGMRGDDFVYGGANNDVLTGGVGDDRLVGGDGADTLNGGVGHDVLLGGADADTLSGGLGRDLIQGGDGADVIDGGADNDIIDGGADNDAIDAGAGNDIVTGGSGNDSVTSGDGDDLTAGGTGDDVLFGDDAIAHLDLLRDKTNVSDATAAGDSNDGKDALFGEEGKDMLIGGGGNDYLDGGDDDDILRAGNGDDILLGGAGNDFLVAGLGNDWADAGDGADVIYGGAGNDTIYAGEGDDEAHGGLDIDVIFGEGGNDKIFGDEGTDLLYGNGGHDTMYGGDGDDGMEGGEGNDYLSGQQGNDLLRGGEGNDSLDGGLGNDRLEGGEGFDRADYATARADVTVSLLEMTASGADAGTDTLVNIVNVHGGAGDDDLTGNAEANELKGGAGNDTLRGNDGNDLLQGYLGNNTLYGGGGIDTADYSVFETTPLSISLADGTARGTDVNDMMTSVENVYGGGANDIIIGNHVDNLLYGNTGDDTLYGGGGNDVLRGGGGNDDIDGGSGADTLSFAGLRAGVKLNLNLGTATRAINSSRTETITFKGIQHVEGSGGNDEITGDEGVNTLKGGAGSDMLYGGDGNDTVLGEEDADKLYGGAGNDRLDGGAGDDVLSYGSGDDVMDGGEGLNDRFDASALTVVLTVNLASGVAASSGSGNDTLTNVEQVYGGSGDDVLTGDAANNTLKGGAGDDQLSGGAGNDFLSDGLGDDTVSGGDGADRFEAAAGNNQLAGGGGGDTVTYRLFSDALIIDLGKQKTSFAAGNSAKDVLLSMEHAEGGKGADVINGSYVVNRLFGDTGNDTLNGMEGNDLLEGGQGDDILSGGAGDDVLDGGVGADDMRGGDGIDALDYEKVTSAVTVDLTTGTAQGTEIGADVFTDVENVYGGAGADALSGSAAINALYGNGGNDALNGLAGNDTLRGGQGDDVLTGDLGNDVLDGGIGNDLVSYKDETAKVTVRLAEGTALVGTSVDRLIGIEQAEGGAGSDLLFGAEGANTLTGNSGNDTLEGGAGADLLIGGTGNDYAKYVTSQTGVIADLSLGRGSAGDAYGDRYESIERLQGSDFGDTLIGNAGNNILGGGKGADTLIGNDGADILYADLGGDNVDGGAGTDELSYLYFVSSDTANPTLGVTVSLSAGKATQGGRSDSVKGIENLSGSTLHDVLYGDDGANVLKGGDGADKLTGRLGADRFTYLSFSDSDMLARDVIQDFTPGVDVLDLSKLGIAGRLTDFTFTHTGDYTYMKYLKQDFGLAFKGNVALAETDVDWA